LQATERALDHMVQATTRPTRRLTGEATMAVRVGRVRTRCKMGQHFPIAITDTQWRSTRDTQGSAAEAALDGGYVGPTRGARATLSPPHVRSAPPRVWRAWSAPCGA